MFLTRTLLDYDVNTDPFPLQASAEEGNLNKARFTVLATNGTGEPQILDGILVQLPVGELATELTFVPANIDPVAPDHWTWSRQTTPGLVQFAFHPQSGHATLGKGESLAFVFKNIEVNRKPGTFVLQITEGSGNCEPDCPVSSKAVSKFPNGWGQVSFVPNPANIPYQGSTTLRWMGPQGATYTIEYMADGRVVNIPRPGEPKLEARGQYPRDDQPPLKLDATTAFTLYVSQRIDNEELDDGKQVTVTVGPAPPPMPHISKFRCSAAVDESELVLTFTWTTERADQVTMTHFPGILTPYGELVIRRSATDASYSSYTLEASTKLHRVSSTISLIWTEYKKVPVPSEACTILPNGSRLFCGHLTVLDPVTLTNVRGSPFHAGKVIAVVPSPDNLRVYAVAGMGLEDLSGYDADTFSRVEGSPVPSWGGQYLAVTPDSKRIYVSDRVHILGHPENVRVFDAAGLKRVAEIKVGNIPRGIAFTRDGSRAFVAVHLVGVVVIDTRTLTVIKTFTAGAMPYDLAVTPDGKELYVGGYHVVSVFHPDTYQEYTGSPIPVPDLPFRIRPSRDGRLMFVQSYRHMSVIDTATRTLVGSSPIVGDYPTDMAVSPDGIRVFVAAGDLRLFLPSATGGIG